MYLWCSCGGTNRQPFCDTSHAGSGRGPLRYRATETGAAWFCGYKLTKTPPLCDGSHKRLSAADGSDEGN
jgi:CDGSH-type Zn-finger protein